MRGVGEGVCGDGEGWVVGVEGDFKRQSQFAPLCPQATGQPILWH